MPNENNKVHLGDFYMTWNVLVRTDPMAALEGR